MTELETLIAEQAKDDTYRVHSISVDAWHSGVDTPRPRLRAHDSRHGTLYCAKVLHCKCKKCREASAKYQREYNRRHRTTRYVCACCGSDDIRREKVG